MSDKERVISAILKQPHASGVLDFDQVLTDAVMRGLNRDRIAAEQFVETNRVRYWNWLIQELDVQQARGIVPFFTIRDRIRRTLFVRHEELAASADRKTANLGRMYRCRSSFLTAIDLINDRHYEALSCLLCRNLGATNVHLTPHGGEGGIDFVATIRLNSSSHIFSALGREFRVVGQSKKYASRVTIDRIDGFLRTMENVRSRSGRVTHHLPAWFDAAGGPIIGWIIAHSGFQTGSSDEGKKHGLILSDTLDVVESLGRSRHFFPLSDPVNRAAQIEPACADIINEFQI